MTINLLFSDKKKKNILEQKLQTIRSKQQFFYALRTEKDYLLAAIVHANSQQQISPCEMQSDEWRWFGGETAQQIRFTVAYIRIVWHIDILAGNVFGQFGEVPQAQRTIQWAGRKNGAASAEAQRMYGARVTAERGDQMTVRQIPYQAACVRRTSGQIAAAYAER